MRPPNYFLWLTMKQRCFNPKHHKYPDYGGRGITVCDRWRDSYAAFMEDMGPRPEGYTLDRWPDNDGNYEPGNCRWATASQQKRNTRITRMVEYQGKMWSRMDLAEHVGINPQTFHMRLLRGWSVEKAVSHPLQQRKSPT